MFFLSVELVLPEGAVVLETVGVSRAADHELARGALLRRFFALARHVVEDDNVGLVDVLFPIVAFGHEAVGNRFFRLVLDVITDVVALLDGPSGNVADQAVDRDEEKSPFVSA